MRFTVLSLALALLLSVRSPSLSVRSPLLSVRSPLLSFRSAAEESAVASSLSAATAPQDTPTPSLAARLSEAVQRDGNGHSPTDEDIAALTANPSAPDADAVRQAIPMLFKALDSTDTPLRTFALTALTALAVPPDGALAVPQGADAPPSAQAPSVFKPAVATALAPAIPKIAARLTEESQANRLLAATVLGGFTTDPPASLYTPLQAFLKRDDAIGPVGLAVVNDLLQLGPLSAETATAIARYLRRSDQTADTRANLVDAIASKPNQSQALNKAVIDYLGADDSNLRARVILSLPQLDLAPEVFADTKAKVATIADNGSENLQVVNAAKSVTPCWTAVKMPTGCPVYQ